MFTPKLKIKMKSLVAWLICVGRVDQKQILNFVRPNHINVTYVCMHVCMHIRIYMYMYVCTYYIYFYKYRILILVATYVRMYE